MTFSKITLNAIVSFLHPHDEIFNCDKNDAVTVGLHNIFNSTRRHISFSSTWAGEYCCRCSSYIHSTFGITTTYDSSPSCSSYIHSTFGITTTYDSSPSCSSYIHSTFGIATTYDSSPS